MDWKLEYFEKTFQPWVEDGGRGGGRGGRGAGFPNSRYDILLRKLNLFLKIYPYIPGH